MLNTRIFLPFLLAVSLSLSFNLPQPQDAEYISFKIKNAGIEVEGKFNSFTAEIKYDADNPNASEFNATIDVSSISTGIGLRDEHLVEKEEYFNVSRFPSIEFKSTRVALLTDGNLKVEGDLKIKGKTSPITMIVHPKSLGATAFFETSVTINRLDYAVGEDSWVMGDDVHCELRVAND